MADEEQDENSSPSIDNEYGAQLGNVVIVEAGNSRTLIGVAVIAILLIVSCTVGWFYLLRSRTDKELLQEKLNHYPAIKAMLAQAMKTIESPIATIPELEEAISTAIDVVGTQLRVGSVAPSPYLPERQAAMKVALEGLLRLDLAMGLDPSDDGDYAFLREQLDRLGREPLEYMEHGIVVEQPLLRSSVLRVRLRRLEHRSLDATKRDIEDLQAELQQLAYEESFTVVGPALLLGKWYRYHNDIESAAACFNLGRSYVEGLRIEDEWWAGRRPTALTPVWSEYVECLDGLAEIAFQNKKYRLARSYLSRSFNTPLHYTPLDQTRLRTRRLGGYAEKLENLHEDAALITKTLQTPFALSSFPHFATECHGIDWERFATLLNDPTNKKGLFPLLLSLLTSTEQEAVMASPTIVPTELRGPLLNALNQLVDEPNLVRRIPYDPAKLSAHGRQLLEREGDRSLSQSDLRFLNRDIIDSYLDDAIHRIVLSDGTRLHSNLPNTLVTMLTSLYEAELARTDLGEEERQQLRRQVDRLYAGTARPSLLELKTMLERRSTYFTEQLTLLDAAVTTQRQALKEIRDAIIELEDQESLDLDALLRYRDQEQRARLRLLTARGERERIKENLATLEIGDEAWTQGLQEQLAATRQKIAILGQHSHLNEKHTAVSRPTLTQIERQLELKNRYVEMLEALHTTKGDEQLRSLDAEHREVVTRLEVLRERLSGRKGNERESIQSEISQLDQRRHQLVIEFSSLFEPLQQLVHDLAAQEEELWEAERQLRAAQEEALQILGSDGVIGSLEQKTQRRAALLLQKNDDGIPPPLYEAEIRKLTDDISEEHARLRILLEQTDQAEQQLALIQPQRLRVTGHTGKLSSLRGYLDKQKQLMDRYHLLWRERQLKQDIVDQEQIVIHSMEMMAAAFDATDELNEQQIEGVNRLMQQLLHSRNKVRQLRDELQTILQRGRIIDGSLFDTSGAGYLLDSTELFQMEHEMGLSIREYRAAFETRRSILEELREALADKKQLEQQQLTASRIGDQEEIDRLLPLLTQRERIITILTDRLASITAELRTHSDDYRKNYKKATAFRSSLEPKIDAASGRLVDLAREMSHDDQELNALSEELFTLESGLDRAITSLTLDDLQDLPSLIASLKEHVRDLEALRAQQFREHFYQARSLWLTGRCLYAQSNLTSYQELAESEIVHVTVLEDEQRHGVNLVPEFDQSHAYSDAMFGSREAARDENRVNFELWIDFLEKAALDLFQEDLPKYLHSHPNPEEASKLFARQQALDANAIIARSRFLSGKIYMKRATRALRASHFEQGANQKAVTILNSARRAFENFLDFSQALELDDHPLATLSEEPPGAQEFPTAQRQPIQLIEKAYIYLGVIATLKEQYSEAIAYHRKLLKHIARKIATTLSEREPHPLGDAAFDPELLLRGYYEEQLSPYFQALTSFEPLTHEILYRIGTNYQALAEAEQAAAVKSENEARWLPYTAARYNDTQQAAEHRQRFQNYAAHAIAHYSQLLLAHTYSPYKAAATVRRARLRALLGDFPGARNDFITVLDDPDRELASSSVKLINPKGDLPSDLNPNYAHVAFELGKLYLDHGDYHDAAETFRKAQDASEEGDRWIIESRIAYAETLKSKGDLVLASLLLQQLLQEKPLVSLELQPLYHYDLALDLADAQRRLGNLTTSLDSARHILSDIPSELVQAGELSLDNKRGLQRLQTSYRDRIRPLARFAKHIAEVFETMQQFDEAQRYYKMGAQLFRMIPWQEDRLTRTWSREQYENYRDSEALACRWAIIRTDILKLQASLFLDLQRTVEKQITKPSTQRPKLTPLLSSIENTLDQVQEHSDDLRELQELTTTFISSERSKLPENEARNKVEQRRNAERRRGGQDLVRYEGLRSVWRKVKTANISSPTELLKHLSLQFTQGSVEAKLLSDFAVVYTEQADLSPKDKSAMVAGSGNIYNLLTIPNADVRLTDLPTRLLAWVEQQMVTTGLDDSFITLSPQSRILEEASLYRASLLAMLPDYDSYHLLMTLAADVVDAMQSDPPRWQDKDAAWQIVEIAAFSSEEREDWNRLIGHSRYLLDPLYSPAFLLEEKRQRPYKALALANALIHTGKRAYEEMVFSFDEEEKKRLKLDAEQQLSEAEKLLTQLGDSDPADSASTSTRVRARQLLERLRS